METIISLNGLAPLAGFQNVVLLAVRILFGVTFFYYGWPKLKDLRSNARDFEGMGFKPGWLWGTPVAFLEGLGSIAVLLGVFTWVMAIGFVIHMTIGAVWKVTSTKKPFTDWSYDLLLLAIALLLLVTGPGAFTVPGIFGG